MEKTLKKFRNEADKKYKKDVKSKCDEIISGDVICRLDDLEDIIAELIEQRKKNSDAVFQTQKVADFLLEASCLEHDLCELLTYISEWNSVEDDVDDKD